MIRSAALVLAIGNIFLSMSAPNPYQYTFCNPINVNYNFFKNSDSLVFREAADPGIIVFKNNYYLVASHSGGYWWSTDMLHWNFVIPTGLNIDAYAPTVEQWNDTMYYTAWGCDLCKTTDPQKGVWTSIRGEPGQIDPCVLKDGNSWFCYSATNSTVLVQVLNPANNFATILEKDSLIWPDIQDHGFEVHGENNTEITNPQTFLEGPWVNKYNGAYYLQYAIPGTEFRIYCDGCYMSKSALGPFTFCPNSPISYKPGGFVTGTGHSCTFTDAYGKYWHVTTVTVSVLTGFERRLAVFPATFDSAGLLHADTYLGDYPQYIPGKAPANATDNLAGLMLLSFNKPVTVSSTLSGYAASNAVDENIRTWWSATSANVGEWLRIDLGASCNVYAIQTNFAEQDITYGGGRGTSFSHKYKIEGALDSNGTWQTLIDKSANTADVPHDYVVLDSMDKVRFVKITNEGPMPGGCKFAIRDLRVFGNASCNAPSAISSFSVIRNAADQRMATITWNKVSDADGYIIREGIAPDKLYNNYQILSKDSTSRVIRSLNVGVTYYFTVDAYSGCGVTKGTIVKRDDNTTITTASIPRPSAAAGNELHAAITVGKQIDISYFIDHACHVSIAVYHVNGQKVASLVDRVENAGMKNVTWNANGNANAAPALCIVAITAGDKKAALKAMFQGKSSIGR
jgi:xylan 1,4-beta-xylosidase